MLTDKNNIFQQRKIFAFQLSSLVPSFPEPNETSFLHNRCRDIPQQENGTYIGILKQVFQFSKFVVGVDCYQNRTDFGSGKHYRCPVGNIFCPNSHFVTRFNSNVEHPFCQSIHPPVKLTVCELQVPVGINDKLFAGCFKVPFSSDSPNV